MKVSTSRESARHEIARAYIVGRVIGWRDDGSVKVEYPALRSLAREHGIALSTIGKWASREGWAEERQRLRRKMLSRQWEQIAVRTYAQVATLE